MLAMTLNTAEFHGWYNTQEDKQSPIILHHNLNYQAAAFEQVEQYIRTSMQILQEDPDLMCYLKLVENFPEYLQYQVDYFIENMSPISEGSDYVRTKELNSAKILKI